MFSNVRFFTMEELLCSGKQIKTKTKTKKPRKNTHTQKIIEHSRECPVLYSKFEPPPANSHPPILSIKLYLALKVTLL